MNNYILEVKNLVRHFKDVRAVDGVSFSIERGCCFGLLGPNGAGKTTTMEMIEGILSPDSGRILYKGKPQAKSFFQEVGVQFQNTEIPMFLTVAETLETFRNLYKHRTDMDELIRTCHLEEIFNKDNRKISGGQKQRLMLAMALANQPELIFLDEPTTGLDPQARRHLWDIVRKLKAMKRTVVLTTHYMEEAQVLCDVITIMDHGKIIAMGNPDELLDKYCGGVVVILKNSLESETISQLSGKYMEKHDCTEIHTHDPDRCIKLLAQKNVDLSSMTVRPMNLEDLFLNITGKELRQ